MEKTHSLLQQQPDKPQKPAQTKNKPKTQPEKMLVHTKQSNNTQKENLNRAMNSN